MGGTYEDLETWQQAMDLVVDLYRITENFPSAEKFGLISQMRRAAVSVPSNIAEGKGRTSDRDQMHFMVCARGSVYELQTQIRISQSLHYLSEEQGSKLLNDVDRVGRLLNGLIRSLRSNSTQPQ